MSTHDLQGHHVHKIILQGDRRKEIEARERTELKLETSGRITPREVLEAYEETGMQPMTEAWYEPSKYGDRACAITVLAHHNGYVGEYACIDTEAFIEERFPYVSEYYQSGFVKGFDGGSCPEPGDDDHPLMRGSEGWERLGWRDGQRVRRFVFRG